MFIVRYLNLGNFTKKDILSFNKNDSNNYKNNVHTLAGRYLLNQTLKEFGFINNQNDVVIKYNNYGRPYLENLSIDFNISHSKDIVACSIVSNGFTGIDVEQMSKLDINDYVSILSAKELELIKNCSDELVVFYKLWTRKEAIMKGEGFGFYMNPPYFDKLCKAYKTDSNLWRIYSLIINNNYMLSIVCNTCDKPLLLEF